MKPKSKIKTKKLNDIDVTSLSECDWSKCTKQNTSLCHSSMLSAVSSRNIRLELTKSRSSRRNTCHILSICSFLYCPCQIHPRCSRSFRSSPHFQRQQQSPHRWLHRRIRQLLCWVTTWKSTSALSKLNPFVKYHADSHTIFKTLCWSFISNQLMITCRASNHCSCSELSVIFKTLSVSGYKC